MQAKIIRKLFLLIAFFLFHSVGQAYQGNGASGFISGAHGGPAVTTCADCHLGSPYGTPSVTHTGSTSVTHDSSTAYTIGLSGSSAIRVGINMAIYNSSNVMQGGFTESDAGLVDVGNELSHPSPQSASKVWSYNWTAPATVGTYTLYYCINQVNNDGLAYDALDGPNRCGSRAISVTNSSPNAANDSYTSFATLDVSESGSFTNYNVCSNDTDAEGDAISYVSNTALSGLTGTLTHGTGCNFSYNTSGTLEALDTGETDTGTFTYTIQDSYGASYQDTATVTIRVTGANDAPIAVADSIAVNEGGTATTLSPSGNNLLTNDIDVDVEPLSAYVVGSPVNGTLGINTDGTFSYTHNGSETTTDSFTYRIYDGTSYSNTVTVNITIGAINDAPTANNDIISSLQISEGGRITVDVVSNDTDPEGSFLGIYYINNVQIEYPGHIVVTNAGEAEWTSDHTITYYHDGSENLSEAFTYRVSDGVFDSNNATVYVTVAPINDAPNITSAAGTTATESAVYSYQLGVTDPDDSNNGSDLTYSLSGAPTGMSVSTTGLITGIPSTTGVFNNTFGPITVTVADGGENNAQPDTEIFSITVSPPDADSDVVADYNDNCINTANNNQLDTDNDAIGDVCDSDPDGNGLLNTYIVFTVTQNGNGNIIFQDAGSVRVFADLAVVGSGTETYDWSQSDSTLQNIPANISGNVFAFNPATLPLGVYNLDVTVTDQGSSTHNTVLINLLAATTPVLTSDDTDGDGTDDVTEGYADADNDGVPNFLDDSSDREFLPTQSLNLSTTRNLQSSTGTFLALGDAAIAAGHYGAVISAADMVNFGGAYGTSTSLAVDVGYTQISEFFDFTVSGLKVGGSVRVVLPLSTGMQVGAIYRKFTSVYGWQNFVVDPNNGIASASSVGGICPAPGSSAYDLNGLNQYADCVQLTLSDGGPNDADGELNGIVRDPGVVVIPTASTTNTGTACSATTFNNCPEQGGSIGLLQPLFMLFMLPTLFAYRLHRKIK